MQLPPTTSHRVIDGISAVLLPYLDDDTPDWPSFRALVSRTYAAGLTPAVNMDTGYVNFIDKTTRLRVLAETRDLAAGRRFVASAYIEGAHGNPAALYRSAIAEARSFGATPILFQCSALGQVAESEVLAVYREVASDGGPLLAFELGRMFAPFGRIYSADFFAHLLELEAFVGAKHSSLDRVCEWERLALRDRLRPDFKVYTGNDLAIDMVFYGSDYLLGLSAFHVEAFALRDRLWMTGDARALAVNDLLQYLGQVAFRAPVPAYKHSAAAFLHLRGLTSTGRPHQANPRRPDADIDLLRDIRDRLDLLLDECSA